MQDRPESSNPLIRLTKNRRLFRLVLLIAVILGIVASTEISSSGTISHTGKLERIISTIIFLVLTILQAFQTFLLARMELSCMCIAFVNLVIQVNNAHEYTARGAKRDNESFGSRHSMAILSLGALLLLVREVFYTATITNTAKQNEEHFWYPLVAVPEILVVILSATPGLVPRREEIQQRLPKLQSAPSYNV
jgi:membrane-associated phospholipid phosphatase